MTSAGPNSFRCSSGSVLVESAVSLWVIFTTFILSLLLLINVCVVSYYKMKLAMVTTQTAAYASSIVTPSKFTWCHDENPAMTLSDYNPQVIAYAQTALKNMGLSGSSAPTITVTYAPDASDVLWVNVFITVPKLSLLGQASFLPVTMDFNDSACGVARYDQPPCLQQFIAPGTLPEAFGIQSCVSVPGYAWAPGGGSGLGALDTMNLRSSYFDVPPQVIPMGIPSAGGGGAIGECWNSGGSTMTTLLGGAVLF